MAPEARGDLRLLYEFIAVHAPEAAACSVQAIVAGADQLSDFPETGRPWSPDMAYRELTVPFGARGYVVRYRVSGERVIIVRVWHGLGGAGVGRIEAKGRYAPAARTGSVHIAALYTP